VDHQHLSGHKAGLSGQRDGMNDQGDGRSGWGLVSVAKGRPQWLREGTGLVAQR
jgi:hypothetical protein